MATGRQAFSGNTSAEIFEMILGRAPAAPVRLNPQIPAELERVINKTLEKDKKLRYQSAADLRSDLQRLQRDSESGRVAVAAVEPERKPATSSAKGLPWIAIAGATLVIIVLAVASWLYFTRKAHALTEKDTIVLADFTNTTGDPVFDGTLRQGLAIQLEQSPFLSIIPEDRIAQTLHLMSQPPDAKLTPQLARDLCQRTGSKAYLSGSINSLGTQFVLGLKAVNCQTGDSLAEEQVQAPSKEQVLSAMDKAATKLRGKLGESLSTVEKLNTPIAQATTPSLDALQAFSLGWNSLSGGDSAAAVPSLERAIRLDPNFAMAYAVLGTSYIHLDQPSLAEENARKAYELRERVSERERFYIEAHYHEFVTGDVEKARQVYELWAQTYPRAALPGNLSSVYQECGQYEQALAESREAVLEQPNALEYAKLAMVYIHLNRLKEARATVEEAQSKGLESADLHWVLYQIAFLQNDTSGAAQQVAEGKADAHRFLSLEALTAAYFGRLRAARELSRRAVTSAESAGEKGGAAGYEADAAWREALVGNVGEAQQRAVAALGLAASQDDRWTPLDSALALAVAGDSTQARGIADDSAIRFPDDTLVRFVYLPTINAQLALNRGDSSKAIETLQAAEPFELGFVAQLRPIYVRGEGYLAGHRGSEATTEFQKILDSRGVVRNDPIGALAHLGLARAYALQGDTAKARAAYQDFLTLWKDADPDIPILIAAKAGTPSCNSLAREAFLGFTPIPQRWRAEAWRMRRMVKCAANDDDSGGTARLRADARDVWRHRAAVRFHDPHAVVWHGRAMEAAGCAERAAAGQSGGVGPGGGDGRLFGAVASPPAAGAVRRGGLDRADVAAGAWTRIEGNGVRERDCAAVRGCVV
jgi:tetratricopeptide (TPR) repeat protein